MITDRIGLHSILLPVLITTVETTTITPPRQQKHHFPFSLVFKPFELGSSKTERNSPATFSPCRYSGVITSKQVWCFAFYFKCFRHQQTGASARAELTSVRGNRSSTGAKGLDTTTTNEQRKANLASSKENPRRGTAVRTFDLDEIVPSVAGTGKEKTSGAGLGGARSTSQRNKRRKKIV